MQKLLLSKKIQAFILGIIMIICLFPGSAVAANFNDTQGNWAESAIDKWSDYGVVQSDGTDFYPNESVTRGDFAVIVNNIMNYQTAATNVFTDLPDSSTYAGPMLKLYAAGVMNGIGDNLIDPEGTLTRQEAFVIFARLFGIPADATGINGFSDADQVASWASAEVGGMVKAGYVQGFAGYLNPTDDLTRAEAVQIIDNIIQGFYNEAGTYTAETSGIVVVNAPGVILDDSDIGKLFATPGVAAGSVELNNSTVGTMVTLCGTDKVVLTNSTVGTTADPWTVVSTERVYIPDTAYTTVQPSADSYLTYKEYATGFYVDGDDATTPGAVKVSATIPTSGGPGALGFGTLPVLNMGSAGMYELGFNAAGVAIDFEKLPFDPYTSYGAPDTTANTIRIGNYMKTDPYEYDANTKVYFLSGNALTETTIDSLSEDWNDMVCIYFNDDRVLTEVYITPVDGAGSSDGAFSIWSYSEGVRTGFNKTENPYPVQYVLYDPVKNGGNEDAKYPLFIYIHGAYGGVNRDGLTSGMGTTYTSADYQSQFETSDPAVSGAYVMLPRANEWVNDVIRSQGWLYGFRGENPLYLSGDESYKGKPTQVPALIADIEDLIANNPNIDPDRIYLTGFSAGGYMTWQTLFVGQDLFAAAAPGGAAIFPNGWFMASPAPGQRADYGEVELGLVDKLESVKDIPIWVYHSRNDNVCLWDLTTGAVFADPTATLNDQNTIWGIVRSFSDGTSPVQGNPLTRVSVFNYLKDADGNDTAQHSGTFEANNNQYNSGISVEGTTLDYYSKYYTSEPSGYNEASPSDEDKASLYGYGLNPDYSTTTPYEDTFINWLNACGNAKAAS